MYLFIVTSCFIERRYANHYDKILQMHYVMTFDVVIALFFIYIMWFPRIIYVYNKYIMKVIINKKS